MTDAYTKDLDRNPANFQPLTPLSFLKRSAEVFPAKLAIVHGPVRHDYATFYARSRQLASALEQADIQRGPSAQVLDGTPVLLHAAQVVVQRAPGHALVPVAGVGIVQGDV